MGHRKVQGYRLHPAAERDLDGIWRFSAEQWSPQQAERYMDELVDSFDLIVEHPELAPERLHFQPPVRLHRHRSHFVAYRVEKARIEILRVFHVRQNWRALLGADADEP
jgi:toxin ParE1/3/4